MHKKYAWFTMSREVEVNNIKMTATVPEDIQISLGTIGTATNTISPNEGSASLANGKGVLYVVCVQETLAKEKAGESGKMSYQFKSRREMDIMWHFVAFSHSFFDFAALRGLHSFDCSGSGIGTT